jgi:YVTN family beta-propeller protein
MGTVSVVAPDPDRQQLVARVPVGQKPLGAGVSPDGRTVYAANSAVAGDNTVSVIDAATHQERHRMKVGPAPLGVAVGPDGTRLYVTCAGSGNTPAAVWVVSASTYRPIATIPVKENQLTNSPFGLAASPDGARLYVTSQTATRAGVLLVIDTTADQIVGQVPVGKSPQGVAVSPDSRRIYVANGSSNTVSAIDAASGTVSTVTDLSAPHAVAVSPDGGPVYVTNFLNNTVSAIDAAALTASTVASVEKPEGIAVSPDGTQLFVASSTTNAVAVIDAATHAVTRLTVGATPVGVAVGRALAE